MKSIYEEPFVEVREVRGEENVWVPALHFWRPDIENTYRSPSGLYLKWVSALARKYQELYMASTVACPRQSEIDWINSQPSSYWFAEEAKFYIREGLEWYGKSSKQPLLPAGRNYGARNDIHCVGCGMYLADKDGRAVNNLVITQPVALCDSCFIDAISNWENYNVNYKPFEHIKKGKLVSHWFYDKEALRVAHALDCQECWFAEKKQVVHSNPGECPMRLASEYSPLGD